MLSKIYERNIQDRIIAKSICLPDVPEVVVARYLRIAVDVNAVREVRFEILVKDASFRTFALFSFCTCFADNRRQISSVIGVLAYLLRIAACAPRVSSSEAPILNLPCACVRCWQFCNLRVRSVPLCLCRLNIVPCIKLQPLVTREA